MMDSENNDNENDYGLRMIEFFSGIGGMRLAVLDAISRLSWQKINNHSVSMTTTSEKLSLKSCQAYDISIHANQTYKHNFLSSQHDDNNNNSKDIVQTKLVEQLKPHQFDGQADLWTMSPPCQPFTNTRGAKMLDINDKRCNGLKAIMKLLTDIDNKPKYILLENVKGFSTSLMLQQWKECLQSNGYSYKEYLVSPIQLGIPNHRQRYYILCEHNSKRWDNSTNEQISTSSIHEHFENNNDNSSKTIHNSGKAPSTLNTNTTTIYPIHPKQISEYIVEDNNQLLQENNNNLDQFLITKHVLQKNWAKHLGIVTPADTASHCFTAGYGRIIHRSTGSILLMPSPIVLQSNIEIKEQQQQKQQQQQQQQQQQKQRQSPIATTPLDRSNMLQYEGRLRRFTPQELLRLFGFPNHFEFPNEINLEHRYKLIGNSINVTVVTELIKELLQSWEVQ